jgi:hypothetical protein
MNGWTSAEARHPRSRTKIKPSLQEPLRTACMLAWRWSLSYCVADSNDTSASGRPGEIDHPILEKVLTNYIFLKSFDRLKGPLPKRRARDVVSYVAVCDVESRRERNQVATRVEKQRPVRVRRGVQSGGRPARRPDASAFIAGN